MDANLPANLLLEQLPSRFWGQLTPLAGGYTNRCWRLDTSQGCYWLRLGSPHAQALGINREHELRAHQAAAQAGLAPKVHFAEPQRGLLLLNWLTESDWQQAPGDVNTLMQSVARLHQLSVTLPLLDLSAQAAHYCRQLIPLAPELAGYIPYFAQSALNLPFHPVLCHHDINAANVLGKRPWLLDWEYAAYGDAAFELAVISDSFNLNAAQQQALLAAYNLAGGKVSEVRFQARLPWVQWLTGLWAALQYQQTAKAEYLAMQQQALTKLAKLVKGKE
ncbi:MAG: phosphotransferase [Oceanisphaera sp.]|uniref:phosphotransferase n=1 Tax=Oceanisphaera sp. TaxID=1929979 RepID=UPI003C7889EA